jgi:outer membrane receptor protein involved in Fe transport
MKKFRKKENRNRRVYLAVISLAALSCGGTALAQTNIVATTNAVASDASTNAVSSSSSTNVANLGTVTVVGQLNQARSQIVPDLGATAYTQTKEQIESASQGGNAPFSQVLLRAPGVAQDNEASGNLHVRGEHANLQYRINDVLLPEGITGFGIELDPRFIDSMQLITGSLPAQYGFRTAGIVDIQTKSGAFENGGQGEVYGGSYDTIRPSFEYGGSSSNLNYFVDGSFDHNDLGIENPTSSHSAIHDTTEQGKGFVYLSDILSDTSRVNFIGSASYSTYEVPNTPDLDAGTAPGGDQWSTQMTTFNSSTNSADVNENQVEQNYYGVVSYQKSAGLLNYQVAAIGRNSDVHFRPDDIGDLYFNGEASDVNRQLFSGGIQADASYELNDKHTIRGGIMALEEYVSGDSATTVFPMDSDDPSSFNPNGAPETFTDNSVLHGLFAGVYLQDEWKILQQVTINYGARFDEFYSSFDKENQPSPRANVIWQPTDSTTLHAGYARYFTPPPIEDVPSGAVNQLDGTSGESPAGPNAPDSQVKAERANYYDAGISQKVTKHLQLGVDGYYKTAHNQLDDGLFGQSLILSAFNYAKGRIYGLEFTGSYNRGGFSSYANLAWSQAYGKDWDSAQFLFDPGDAAYVKNHWIYLDHDQRLTGTFGVDYTWKEGRNYNTRVYADALYGSGLRTDSPTVPNGASVPQYYSINIGAEQSFNVGHNKMLKARFDVVNLTDNSYELRDGGGVGVNAASYGERLGFFGSLSFVF